jgi:hypothetical protein
VFPYFDCAPGEGNYLQTIEIRPGYSTLEPLQGTSEQSIPRANIPSGAKQAAEKGLISTKMPEKHTSGAKAHADFKPLTARLKPCPFKAISFSAACKAHVHFSAICGTTKVVPFQNIDLLRDSPGGA